MSQITTQPPLTILHLALLSPDESKAAKQTVVILFMQVQTPVNIPLITDQNLRLEQKQIEERK